MIADILFYAGLLVSLSIGFIYFRDLGDVSQMVLTVKRKNMIRFIRHEYKFIAVGVGSAVVMHIAFIFGGGMSWLFWISLPVIAFLYGFPWVWVHIGLRNQKDTAKYYSIEDARDYVNPSASVMVIENNGHARAHSDGQMLRPHMAGNKDGLDGEDVVLTYCAMANLGIGYEPSIEGKRLNLEVLAQHGNNLILRDNDTGEPIQHIYGFRESDIDQTTGDGPTCSLKPGLAMKPWPTFRMSFRGFQKAFPNGEVFVNKPASNPFLKMFDMVTETIFASGISRQHQEAAPVMDNMTHFDDRLPNKTYVWGVTVGNDAACWTDDFVMENNMLVNANVGGRDLVVNYDLKFESIGIWYNDYGKPVTTCDFWGNSDQGKLERVETVRPGLFWHVWVEFFPHSDINRT